MTTFPFSKFIDDIRKDKQRFVNVACFTKSVRFLLKVIKSFGAC